VEASGAVRTLLSSSVALANDNGQAFGKICRLADNKQSPSTQSEDASSHRANRVRIVGSTIDYYTYGRGGKQFPSHRVRSYRVFGGKNVLTAIFLRRQGELPEKY
jgi:hypothetical protein